MGILDFLTAKKYKEQIESLQKLLDEQKSPKEEILCLPLKVEVEPEPCLEADTNLHLSYGLYEPKYGFENSNLYKEKLAEIRDRQKQLIKNKEATHHNLDAPLYEDKKKGKDLILDTIKLSLRTFNSECELLITKAKQNTLAASEKRMQKIFDEINALTKMQQVSLRTEYLDLKIAELHLKHEYEVKKEEEKEDAKILKELESARKKLEKDEVRFNTTIQDVHTKLQSATEREQPKLLKKLKETETKLTALKQAKQDILIKEQNTGSGYIYIISNMGSFGEDVYKIGMTRKLEPEESIKELGGASVPFDFDSHAMIFSEDAVALEKKLYKQLANYQINKVNPQKNFFKISLNELETIVRTVFDEPITFTRLAEAEEYKKSCSATKAATINALILTHASQKDS